jgi:hypothetical protein
VRGPSRLRSCARDGERANTRLQRPAWELSLLQRDDC